MDNIPENKPMTPKEAAEFPGNGGVAGDGDGVVVELITLMVSF